MVMVENVWECREEEMTLLPEAVGAGMWKPEYEFPGMHCSQAHTARHALPGTARHAQLGMHCQVLQGMHCKACTAPPRQSQAELPCSTTPTCMQQYPRPHSTYKKYQHAIKYPYEGSTHTQCLQIVPPCSTHSQAVSSNQAYICSTCHSD